MHTVGALRTHPYRDEQAFCACPLHVGDPAVRMSEPGLCRIEVRVAEVERAVDVCDGDMSLSGRYGGDLWAGLGGRGGG